MATFYNQATLSYSGGIVNSNITVGELIEAISVTKTAIVDEYSQNSDVSYAINIINSGAIAFNRLTLTDDLGAYSLGTAVRQPLDYVDGSVKYFINGVLQADPAVNAGTHLVITGINVPADSNVTILYTARTNGFASPVAGATIVNTVVISGDGISNITASETVSAKSEPILNITKSLFPSTVTESGQLTYTFVIQNIGNTEAVVSDDAVIRDTFDPILSNLSVSYNGVAWAENVNYTYNEATGEFATLPGQITVPAATYTQDPTTGVWTINPGTVVLTVSGTV